MTGNTAHDVELKMNLLDDTFTVVDLEKVYLCYLSLTGNEE